MARGVLGNDPFRRGAAAHPEPADPEARATERSPKRADAANSRTKARAVGTAGAASTLPEKAKQKTPRATSATATGRAQAAGSKATKGADRAAAKASSEATVKSTQPEASNAKASSAKVASAKAANAKAVSANVANATTSNAKAPSAKAANATASNAKAANAKAPSAKAANATASHAKAANATAPNTKAVITKAANASPAKAAAPKSPAAPSQPVPHQRPASTRTTGDSTSASNIANAKPHASGTEDTQHASSEATRHGAGPSPTLEALPDAPHRAAVASTPPHLVLVAGDHDPQPAPHPLPPLPSERDDAATRALRVLGFARDLATAGLQLPELVDAFRVARGLARGALGGLGAHLGQKVDAYGRDPGLVADLEPLTELLYTHYWRVTVQGAVHVPTGPVVLVANHSGVIPYDGPVLQQVLLRERPDLNEARWLVEDQIFHAPFFGTLFNRLGALRACPENARRLLSEDRPVCVFPEGAQGLGKTFGERDQLKRFGRGGFVKVALRAGVPIVPVAIVGAEETSPLLARLPGSLFGLGYIPLTPAGPLPLPARWMIRFGEPLDTAHLGPEDADNLPVVQRLTERTRETIQGMRQALGRERKGLFR